MKLSLVDNWKSFWAWYSTWMHLIGTTIAGVLLLVPSMPPEVQAIVPVKWRVAALGLWLIAGFVARVVKQGPQPPAAP